MNKNTVLGDRNAISPAGVRLGSPALTTRGMVEKDFDQIAAFLHRLVEICSDIQAEVGREPCTGFV